VFIHAIFGKNSVQLDLQSESICAYVYTDMATIQKRTSRGHTYWAIVESRRVNGKPRPIVLEHLGTADNLLRRLRGGVPQKVKSYAHGLVAVLLNVAESLKLVQIINRHLPRKQFRDGFTVGGSLLLAAIGRICQPTSKRNWFEGWAKHTSLSYLLRRSLSDMDSQHFWDQMNAVPVTVIPQIEEEIVNLLYEGGYITVDTLLYDTTNFFTYIGSTNRRCTMAQRGKNKQRRIDLRQFGLLLLVSQQDQIPIFHKMYQGNLADATVFKDHFKDILNRFKKLSGSLEHITVVFDQGSNSKESLRNVDHEIHFVGALSAHQHKGLIEEANKSFNVDSIRGRNISCYRSRRRIWGIDLTALVYISEKLREGQIRGVEQNIGKLWPKFSDLRQAIRKPTQIGKKRTEEDVKKRINSLIGSHIPREILGWKLTPLDDDAFELEFWIDEEQFGKLKEKWFGRRILITNRHEWTTEQIMTAYWGQAHIEYAFKNMKNPFHLAWRPQYHWTDQKIEVHGFICLLAFLLVMIIYKQARDRCGFPHSPHTLLEKLSAIRIATFIESPEKKSRGLYKAVYKLEELDPEQRELAEAMGITQLPLKTNIPFSVYSQSNVFN
jgi:transposase